MTELELLSRAAFSLSLFVTYLLLWLGMTTLLTARRDQSFSRAAGVCLLLGAVFFLSHAMIVGKGPTTAGIGIEIWWRIGWLPAVSAPISWYAAVIRYAGLSGLRQRLHRRLWLVLAALGLLIVILLVTDNPFASYQALLLDRSLAATSSQLLVWLYLGLNVAGFALSVVALVSGRGEQPARGRAQARPWLMGTSLALLGASAIVSAAAVWAVERALPLLLRLSAAINSLLAADLAAQALVAVAAILLGRAVVAYEVFTERPLPRQGFFRRWRSVVLAAAACAAMVAILLALEVRPLYSLAILSMLGFSAYALFTWQSYAAHERFITRLLPFVASQQLSEQLLSTDPPNVFSDRAGELLRALCEDALGVASADLALEGDPPRHVTYRRTMVEPAAERRPDDIGLRLDLAAGYGSRGALLLGRRLDGRPYAAEEIALARACGERLLDALAGERIARLLMDVLRRRLGELQVLSTQHKRVLHDEVLPDIHAALLRLEDPSAAGQSLTRAHRTLSELLQSGPKSAASQIAFRGLMETLQETVEREFVGSFATIRWETTEAARTSLSGMATGLVAEVMYFAAVEAVRNAARHASGGDPARRVSLQLSADWVDGLEIVITDDGVGFRPEAATTGTGQGLLFHSTMMAVVGGRLAVALSSGGHGTTVRLWAPGTALRPSPAGPTSGP
jgi:two-component sensor histidine kinase